MPISVSSAAMPSLAAIWTTLHQKNLCSEPSYAKSFASGSTVSPCERLPNRFSVGENRLTDLHGRVVSESLN